MPGAGFWVRGTAGEIALRQMVSGRGGGNRSGYFSCTAARVLVEAMVARGGLKEKTGYERKERRQAGGVDSDG
jgi:hypothetical protein